MIPTLTESVCQQLTPLVRAEFKEGIFGPKVNVTALTETSCLTGRLRRKASLLDAVDRPSLIQRLKRIKEVPFDEVTSAEVRRGGRRTRWVTIRLKSVKKSRRLRLPTREAEHFLGILHTRLGERLTIRKGVPLHGWALNFVLIIAIGLAGSLFYFGQDLMAGVLVTVFSVLPLLLVQIYDHVPAPLPWEISTHKKTKAVKDRSGIQPYRSKWIGWVLKLGSVAVLIGLWLSGLMLFAPLALVLLYLGNLIASVPPTLVRESDQRAPILYLRSFLDDRKTNLTPDTRYAIALGVMPPALLPTPWRYLFYFHPVRVLRILFGASVDTSEEQLALFLRTQGPVVAIGKPGERFASPGASRMYVTNEEWQNVVLEHLESSQIVLLQPAQTEGIWWEVEKTIGRVAPQKVLLCMVNFLHCQNDYEKFRLRAAQFIKHPLPRNLAYTQTASFLYFDGDWRPFVQEVSCRSPLIWPVVGNAIDLKYTLQPFLNSAQTVQARPPHADAENDAENGINDLAVTTDSVAIEPLHSREGQVASMLPTMLPRPPRGVSHGAQLSANIIFFALLLSVPMIPLLVAAVSTARKAAQRANIENTNFEDANATNTVVANPQAETPNSLGIAYYKEGNFDLALAELSKSIEVNDQDPEAFLFRGNALESLQRREEAIHDYERAIALDPTLSLAWNNLGFNYQQMGNDAQAIRCYSKAIELSDEDASYFANRGIALLTSGQADPAIADLTRSLEIDAQQPQVYRYKGQALAQKGEWVEAIKHFNTALQADPDIVDAYYHRGKAFMALGDQKSDDFDPYELARQNFDEYFIRAPNDTRILLEHAEANRLDGKHDDAIADLSKFLGLVPGDDVALERRLNVFYQAGRIDEAIADANALIQKHPDDPGKMELLASLLFMVERYDEAITQTDATIAKFPDALDSYRIRGNCLYRQRRYDEALENYGHILKQEPHDPVSLANRAQMFAIRNQFGQSAAEYRTLVEAQPDQFDPRYFLAYALAAGDQEDELNSVRSSLKKTFGDTTNPEIQMLMTRLSLLGSKPAVDWASGFSVVKGLHEANPEHDDIGLLYGAFQIHTAQFADAEATLLAVVQRTADPRIIASAQLWLSQAQTKLGKLEEAKQSLKTSEAWIQKYASLEMEKEQAVRDETATEPRSPMEWWQRVELQNWMTSALKTLANGEPTKVLPVKLEQETAAPQTPTEAAKE